MLNVTKGEVIFEDGKYIAVIHGRKYDVSTSIYKILLKQRKELLADYQSSLDKLSKEVSAYKQIQEIVLKNNSVQA